MLLDPVGLRTGPVDLVLATIGCSFLKRCDPMNEVAVR
jgi:hypothetical protein